MLRLAAEVGQRAFTAQDLRTSCAAWIDAQLPVDVRRHLHRAVNERRSGRAVAGLTLLLALCGWINAGDDGARSAVIAALPQGSGSGSSETMRRRGDARRLYPADAPELIALVHDICRRAGLRRMPEVYVLPGERSMNAYALGTPDDAAITLTAGLLDGMTRDEVAAIVAHEIAHICNGDAATMAIAAGLHRAIRLVSTMSLVAGGRRGASAPGLIWLLQAAPALAELLCLSLSRIRELAADAFALDLIADARTLATALEKLERHHRGAEFAPSIRIDGDLTAYLLSHPPTDQRVSFVHVLA
jgi:heat shock protein HtpX